MLASVLSKIEGFLWSTPFILFVILVGVYFTCKSGFFTVRYFPHIIKHTLGAMLGKEANTKKEGAISPFEAVCIAIGGSVGVGNIGGVASAIAAGGPGAVFWMWLWAFFGMMVKCVETTLGCYYRSKDEKGNFFGGSMHFMEKGIGREMKIKAGFSLSIAFSIGFIFQFIQGSQAYTISEVLNTAFGLDMIVVTLIYTLALLYIVWKGTPRIAKFASGAVPFMCLAFVLGGLGLIIVNIENVPAVFSSIFKDAFTGTAATGGFIGATVSAAMSKGVSRSINSNEAGQGSSPLVHGSADTIHPVRQGLWGAFEVFIDTIVVCSITALAVLCSGAWETGATGATLTILAYETSYGQLGKVFIGIMCILFGMTTTAGWFTYYITVIRHLFRFKPILRDKLCTAFKIIFPLTNVVIVSYIVLSGNSADLFWTIVSIVLAAPVFTNLIALICLRKKFFVLFKDYKARYMGKGVVDPNFYVFYEDDPVIAAQEEEIREKVRQATQGVNA